MLRIVIASMLTVIAMAGLGACSGDATVTEGLVVDPSTVEHAEEIYDTNRGSGFTDGVRDIASDSEFINDLTDLELVALGLDLRERMTAASCPEGRPCTWVGEHPPQQFAHGEVARLAAVGIEVDERGRHLIAFVVSEMAGDLEALGRPVLACSEPHFIQAALVQRGLHPTPRDAVVQTFGASPIGFDPVVVEASGAGWIVRNGNGAIVGYATVLQVSDGTWGVELAEYCP